MNSQGDRILDLFKKERVVTNRQLNDIAFRYGARIHELRKDGYDIRTRRVKEGLFEFELVDE